MWAKQISEDTYATWSARLILLVIHAAGWARSSTATVQFPNSRVWWRSLADMCRTQDVGSEDKIGIVWAGVLKPSYRIQSHTSASGLPLRKSRHRKVEKLSSSALAKISSVIRMQVRLCNAAQLGVRGDGVMQTIANLKLPVGFVQKSHQRQKDEQACKYTNSTKLELQTQSQLENPQSPRESTLRALESLELARPVMRGWQKNTLQMFFSIIARPLLLESGRGVTSILSPPSSQKAKRRRQKPIISSMHCVCVCWFSRLLS